MFSSESPPRGDSNKYTQYTIVNIKKEKLLLIISNLQLWDFCDETQERVRNSRGKQAISVRATEVLLYLLKWMYTVEQRTHNLFVSFTALPI